MDRFTYEATFKKAAPAACSSVKRTLPLHAENGIVETLARIVNDVRNNLEWIGMRGRDLTSECLSQ
jgi:hypothetical protein